MIKISYLISFLCVFLMMPNAQAIKPIFTKDLATHKKLLEKNIHDYYECIKDDKNCTKTHQNTSKIIIALLIALSLITAGSITLYHKKSGSKPLQQKQETPQERSQRWKEELRQKGIISLPVPKERVLSHEEKKLWDKYPWKAYKEELEEDLAAAKDSVQKHKYLQEQLSKERARKATHGF